MNRPPRRGRRPASAAAVARGLVVVATGALVLLAVLGAGDPLLLAAAAAGAALAYPAAVICVWTWRAWRARRRLRLGAGPPPPFVLPPVEELSCGQALARYCVSPRRFHPAEALELLIDGEQAFPRMLEAIDAARETIDLEAYILRDDATGRRFLEALRGAAGRGVEVRVLYDYVGSLSLPRSSIRALLSAGAAVAAYNPPVLARISWRGLNRRNHRKTLVADGRVTFLGGMNLSDEYASSAGGGGGWRDTLVRIEGRAAALQAALLFESAWRKSTPYRRASRPGRRRRRLRAALRLLRQRAAARGRRASRQASRQAAPPEACAGGPAVQVLGNRGFGNRRLIQRSYLQAIRKARRYILMENAYFIPNRAVRRALAEAVRRGVLVAVIVPHDSDVRIVACAGRFLYSRLLTAGVRLFEWPAGMMHAKTAVVDDAWSVVGSYNFDHRSLLHQLESVAIVADGPFARRLRAQSLADLAASTEVRLATHESRPLRRLFAESAAYYVRHLL